jgi:adenylate cyclase
LLPLPYPVTNFVAARTKTIRALQAVRDTSMTRLLELVRSQPKQGFEFPAWLERLVSVGIVTSDPQVARRQRFVNVAAYATAVNTGQHIAFGVVYAFQALAIVHIYNAIIIVIALMIPRLHRYGDNIAAITLLSVDMLGHVFVVCVLGRDSGLQIYFTLAGATLFMFGVEQWRLFLTWFTLSCAALIFVMRFAPPQGVLLVSDPSFRQLLSSMAMIQTTAINAALIFYALAALHRAESELVEEHGRSEALIESIIPPSIAARLKSGEQRVADRIENLSVLFADLVGFTGAAHDLSPGEIVAYLDSLVRAFDALCEIHGAEKIKTIGDCYMAVTGRQEEDVTGANRIARLALAMLKLIDEHPPLGDRRLKLRIGIHCGPAIAGVIGETRIAYDVWGEAVNIASRMESQGLPGRIQISEAFHSLIGPNFYFEERGKIDIKGLPASRTFFLVSSR